MLNDSCKLIFSVLRHHDFVSSFSTTETTNIFMAKKSERFCLFLLIFLFFYFWPFSSLFIHFFFCPFYPHYDDHFPLCFPHDFYIHHTRPESRIVDNLVDKMFKRKVKKAQKIVHLKLVKASKMICFHDSLFFLIQLYQELKRKKKLSFSMKRITSWVKKKWRKWIQFGKLKSEILLIKADGFIWINRFDWFPSLSQSDYLMRRDCFLW